MEKGKSSELILDNILKLVIPHYDFGALIGKNEGPTVRETR